MYELTPEAAVELFVLDMMLTQRVHLQLLPQADLLQAVVEVGLRAAAHSGRKREDPHDLPLVSNQNTS